MSIYTANPENTLQWGVANYREVEFHANGTPRAISLNNKNISLIPDNIDQLSALETLNANSNTLENLPTTLANIGTLSVFNPRQQIN